MNPNNAGERVRDCNAVRDLIPEYAFGLTTPDETRLIESSLSSCPEAASDLEDYRRLQEDMRAGVPQIEPPPLLGARLMDTIATPEAKATPRYWSFRLPWVAAAAAIIGLVVTNIYWLVRVDDLIRRQDQLLSQIGAPDSNAFVLTSTANLHWVRLPPDQEGSDASAFLMWNAESAIGLLYAHGFPQLPPGKTYQLWLTRGEERVDGGTFQVDEQGNGALLFHITEPIDEYTWARITEEQGSGSDEPSSTVLVRGEL